MITLGLVANVDTDGVYVTMPGSRGLLRGPYLTLQDVAVGDRVLTVTTDDGETVIVGLASAAAPRSSPASSTDNAVARFNGTGGALQNSGVTIDDSNRINTTGVTGTSNYVFVAATNNSSIMWNRASGASGNYAYQIWQTRTGQSDENETQTGLSYDGSLYLQQKKVNGSSVNRDIWNIRPDGKFRLVFCGAAGGFELGSGGPRIMAGTGSPESVVSAPVGSLWLRTDSSATLYVKQTGTGNTGWVAK